MWCSVKESRVCIRQAAILRTSYVALAYRSITEIGYIVCFNQLMDVSNCSVYERHIERFMEWHMATVFGVGSERT